MAHDCERDKWLEAEEAVTYGVADRVLEQVPTSIRGDGAGSDDDR